MPFNQAMCKPFLCALTQTLWTKVFFFLNMGILGWILFPNSQTSLQHVNEPAWIFGKSCEEPRRDQRNFINHCMPQTNTYVSRKSSGRAEAGCDSSWIVPLSQHNHHRFLSPSHMNSLSAARPNSEAEGSVLLTQRLHWFFLAQKW